MEAVVGVLIVVAATAFTVVEMVKTLVTSAALLLVVSVEQQWSNNSHCRGQRRSTSTVPLQVLHWDTEKQSTLNVVQYYKEFYRFLINSLFL